MKYFGFILFILNLIVGCQAPPTKVLESDSSLESRVYSKIKFGEKVDFKNSVIIDVRSRFEFEMAKLPRSFNAYWKDWDLRDYKNNQRVEKVKELQRLLALHGVDTHTQVVVLGKGLRGHGEEFLVASTLLTVGVSKINFINEKQVKEAVLSKNLPPLENLPYWQKEAILFFECKVKSNKSVADIVINRQGLNGTYKVESLFNENLKTLDQSFPKSLNLKITSKESFWSYGLALYFIEQGRKPCVL